MTKPLIPSPASIVGPGAVELVRRRPGVFDNVNYGRGVYSTVLAGIRAQAALAIAGLADGAVGSNLKLAKGAQLLANAASEYAIPTNLGRTKSVGDATLDRSSSILPLLGGSIKKGTRLSRSPELTMSVPIQAAEYVTTSDVPVLFGQTIVKVPIQAVRDGASANTPRFAPFPYKSLALSDALFDPAFKVTGYDAGGGSDGLGDAEIARYASAFAAGNSGPTDASIVVAALSAPGVRHLLLQDPSFGGMTVFVADPSWAGSERWRASVEQSISDSDFMGHGCQVTVALIDNVVVNCTLTVRVRDTSYLSDTSEIDAAIRKSVRAYFDNREDFNVFGVQPLRGVVSRADRRILRCTAASINKLDGTSFAYMAPYYGHLYLSDNAVSITYQGPV